MVFHGVFHSFSDFSLNLSIFSLQIMIPGDFCEMIARGWNYLRTWHGARSNACAKAVESGRMFETQNLPSGKLT